MAEVNVSEIDRVQINCGLAFIGDIDGRINQSEATIRTMIKANANVNLLKTIPGIGEFFARLIDAEVDDISRFRNPKKLAAYTGLVPSSYSSGGKTLPDNGPLQRVENLTDRPGSIFVSDTTHPMSARRFDIACSQQRRRLGSRTGCSKAPYAPKDVGRDWHQPILPPRRRR